MKSMRTKAELFNEYIIGPFDVRKYARAKELDERGWSIELRARKTYASDHFLSNEKLAFPTLREIAEDPIRTLGNHGPADDERLTLAAVRDVDLTTAWDMRNTIERDPVAKGACEAWEAFNNERSTAGDSLELGSEEWWQAIMEDVHAQKEKIKPVAKIWGGSFNALCRKAYLDTEFVYAEINLSAPDAVILREFQKWIAEKRKSPHFAHSPVRRFSKSDFARWSQKRVLAYIDLTTAARFFGVELPYHRMGSLLFPDIQDVDLAEKVRKTVAPLADELLADEFQTALYEAANARRLELAAEGIQASNSSG